MRCLRFHLSGAIVGLAFGLPLTLVVAVAQPAAASRTGQSGTYPASASIAYIDTSFENASPLWWEVDADGVVLVHLNYDHERNFTQSRRGPHSLPVAGENGREVHFGVPQFGQHLQRQARLGRWRVKALVVSEDGRRQAWFAG